MDRTTHVAPPIFAVLTAAAMAAFVFRGHNWLAFVSMSTVYLLIVSILAGQRRIMRAVPPQQATAGVPFQLYCLVMFSILGIGIAFFAGTIAVGGIHR